MRGNPLTGGREPFRCVAELESLTSGGNAMTFKFTYLGAWVPGLLVASTLVAQAGPVCEQWNTREYFLTATVEEVTSCLAAGGDIEAQTENGRMPLHYAAWSSKNPAVVKTLLEAGAKLGARSKNGNTPLILAAWGNGNPAVIEALLAAGADPRVRNKAGNTPLHDAARANRNPAVTELLLEAGSDLEARDRAGRTPLHQAAGSSRNPVVIDLLLEAGADPNAQDAEGKTPWNLAQANEALKGTETYSRLHAAQFKSSDGGARGQ